MPSNWTNGTFGIERVARQMFDPVGVGGGGRTGTTACAVTQGALRDPGLGCWTPLGSGIGGRTVTRGALRPRVRCATLGLVVGPLWGRLCCPPARPHPPPTTPPSRMSAEVRARLVDAVELDLIGPRDGLGTADEGLDQNSSRWYLTGFLVPAEAGEEQKSTPSQPSKSMATIPGAAMTPEPPSPPPPGDPRCPPRSASGCRSIRPPLGFRSSFAGATTRSIPTRWTPGKTAPTTQRGNLTRTSRPVRHGFARPARRPCRSI